MVIAFLILALLLIFVCGLFLIIDCVHYNRGHCPHCKKLLKKFGTDSHKNNGYICHDCGYSSWISFHIVDRKHDFVREKSRKE